MSVRRTGTISQRCLLITLLSATIISKKKAKKASKQVRFHDKTTVKQKIIQDSNLQGQNSPFHGTVFQ
jgi:hypothetical protein